jgi:formate dehydrogenase subunit delta
VATGADAATSAPDPSEGAGAPEPPHVRLANDIAAQFHARPPDEAAEMVATHIRQFWDPRMRAQLLAHVDAGGAGLDPLAVDAAHRLRSHPAR